MIELCSILLIMLGNCVCVCISCKGYKTSNCRGPEGHHVARANEALRDAPGKRTCRVVLGVIVDQLANPIVACCCFPLIKMAYLHEDT